MKLTASTITDDQVDALTETLDLLESLHYAAGRPEDYDSGRAPCAEDGDDHPCKTIEIISRQRSKIEEAASGRSTD